MGASFLTAGRKTTDSRVNHLPLTRPARMRGRWFPAVRSESHRNDCCGDSMPPSSKRSPDPQLYSRTAGREARQGARPAARVAPTVYIVASERQVRNPAPSHSAGYFSGSCCSRFARRSLPVPPESALSVRQHRVCNLVRDGRDARPFSRAGPRRSNQDPAGRDVAPLLQGVPPLQSSHAALCPEVRQSQERQTERYRLGLECRPSRLLLRLKVRRFYAGACQRRASIPLAVGPLPTYRRHSERFERGVSSATGIEPMHLLRSPPTHRPLGSAARGASRERCVSSRDSIRYGAVRPAFLPASFRGSALEPLLSGASS